MLISFKIPKKLWQSGVVSPSLASELRRLCAPWEMPVTRCLLPRGSPRLRLCSADRAWAQSVAQGQCQAEEPSHQLQHVPKASCATMGVFCGLQVGKRGYRWVKGLYFQTEKKFASQRHLKPEFLASSPVQPLFRENECVLYLNRFLLGAVGTECK